MSHAGHVAPPGPGALTGTGDAGTLGTYTLLPWRRLPFPIPWADVFGARRPLHLEVGFGDGRFTVRRALEEPEASFVGLEISNASLQRASARVARTGTSNVRLLKVGAEFAVRYLFPQESLASIVVNFPDPWPKAKHEEHRLLKRPFFELAASRLVERGEIRLATDHPDYLAFAREAARASRIFDLVDAEPPEAVFETKYALKWRAQGKPLHYQIFRKAGEPATPWPVPERPQTMPHALLRGSIPQSIPFDKIVAPYGEGHVILHEVAVALPAGPDAPADAGRLLVRATVDEPDIRQQLLVVVQQRGPTEAIVRITTFGDPIITEAVRGAVHLTTEWLLDRTDLALLARNY